MKKSDFYRVEMNVGGKSYVTARGWEDLSATILLCEEENLPVDETLVAQYLHNEKIVKEFTAYYELYNKYKKTIKWKKFWTAPIPRRLWNVHALRSLMNAFRCLAWC